MLRIVLRALVQGALVLGAAFSVSSGCSRQAEGERCDFTWAGDQDCADGLVCTPCGNLQQQSIDRCCKPGGLYTDARCAPGTPTGLVCNTHVGSGTGGTTAASGGTAGMGASSGTSASSGTGGGENAGAGDQVGGSSGAPSGS